jgi:hypothetical protein
VQPAAVERHQRAGPTVDGRVPRIVAGRDDAVAEGEGSAVGAKGVGAEAPGGVQRRASATVEVGTVRAPVGDH